MEAAVIPAGSKRGEETWLLMQETSLAPARRYVAKRDERGYILLVLMLFIVLLTIAAAAIAPSVAFEVRRDREQELIHRGVQYSRAVRHYFKKFNRYPTKIEDLESSNNMRFLRKRYKDPITGQDFKVVYLMQVQAAMGGGPAGGATGPGGSGSPTGNQFGQTSNGFGAGNFGAPAKTASSPDSTAGADAGVGSQPGSGSSNADSNKGASDLTSQTFGGGPIAGVASTSKAESIREFNKKSHYNEWLFIYDPQSDRGGLLSTPNQPPLAGAAPLTPSGSSGSAPGFSLGGPGMGSSTPQQVPQQAAPSDAPPTQ